MILTDKQLELIEQYAGSFLIPREIAVLIDVDAEEFLMEVINKKTEAFRSYHRGRLMKKVAVRDKVITMAIKGSPAAEEFVNKYIQDQELEYES